MKKVYALYLALSFICVSAHAGHVPGTDTATNASDTPPMRKVLPRTDTQPDTEPYDGTDTEEGSDDDTQAPNAYPALVRQNAVGFKDVLRSRAEAAKQS